MKMINKCTQFIGAAVLAIIIAFGPLSLIQASAGASDNRIDSSSFAKELDATIWNAPNGDIYAKNGKIIFDENTADGTRLITTKAIKASKYNDELFKTEYIFMLKKLSDGNKFLILFGMNNTESEYSEDGNIALVFEKSTGLKVSLVTYDDSGEATVLARPVSVGNIGKAMTVSAIAKTDNHLEIAVNGIKIFKGAVTPELVGRMGFAVTGAVQAEITKVDILSHRYDNPENANISEDFESGTMNINVLESCMLSSDGYSPASLTVQEYNGNKVLMFRNVGTGYVATTYQYSNFEISFDMPYAQFRSHIYDDATAIDRINMGLVLSFGDETSEFDSLKYDTSPEAIVFANTSISRLKHDETTVDLREKAPGFYSAQDNLGYSVKVRVEDGNVCVYAKAISDTKYTQMFSYSLNNVTPLGYIHLWSKESANVAIDNLKIINLDKNPNLLDPEYKNGFISDEPDWDYKPFPVDYVKNNEQSKQDGVNWLLLAIIEAAVGVVVAAGSIIIVKIKRKSKKGECVTDES